MSNDETILVVDDEPMALMVATRALKHQGYNVLSTDKPEEAFDLIDQSKGSIRVLLSDVMMPGLSGKDLGILVQKQDPSIQILYMSAYQSEVIGHEGLNTAEVDFIAKPFSSASLNHKIRELLDRNKGAS